MALDMSVLSAFTQSENFAKGQEFIQKLFAYRFITKSYSNESKKLYNFGLSYREELSIILKLCGYDLVIQEGQETIYVESDTKTNRIPFTKDETVVYLRLLQRYKKNILNLTGSGRKEADVEIQDLLYDINSLRGANGKKPMLLSELRTILGKFYKMQLIRLDRQTREKIKDLTETSTIFVLSSICCILTSTDITNIENMITALYPPSSANEQEDTNDGTGGDDNAGEEETV